MSADCLFCRIVRGEIPATLIAQTEDCIAFRDINPQAPVHVLVIPRKHVASLDALRDADILGKAGLLVAEIARTEGVDQSGYRVVINNGSDAGQTVGHLHLHLLGGRKLKWPPG